MTSRAVALRDLRITDGSTKAMEPKAPEEISSPLRGLPGLEVSPLALHEEAAEPTPDMGVQLIELLGSIPIGSIPGAEAVALATQHAVQVPDQHPDILHTVAVMTNQLLHTLLHLLHRFA